MMRNTPTTHFCDRSLCSSILLGQIEKYRKIEKGTDFFQKNQTNSNEIKLPNYLKKNLLQIAGYGEVTADNLKKKNHRLLL